MKYLAILLVIVFAACEKAKPTQEYLGVVNLKVTGEEKALPHFERGLLLLHSFEYADARESFQEAKRIDPEMGMAYWGEAMTHNHSLWHEQNYDKGMAVVKALKKIKTTENSPLEKDLIEAVDILYASDSVKETRDQNYARFMQKLHKKYPDNHEVAAFYALSLLGSVPDGRDEEIYGDGALIAQGILKENPNHPGALHYLIHSYDDPGHAKLALDAANSYAVVAPDASHALHMPSHIYVALGMWEEVVSSNIDSYQASLNRMERKGLGNNARGYHAYHWLQYGYLQLGEKEKANQMTQELVGYVQETPSSRARAHMVFLKGTYLSETEDWQSPIADIEVDLDGLNLTVRNQYRYLDGVKGFQREDGEALGQVISEMEKDLDRESYLVTYEEAPFCSGASRYDTTPSMLAETKVMIEQLKACQAILNEDKALAEQHLQNAVRMEENLSYSYGPPVIQKPTHEMYADWLKAEGRTEEATAYYQKTLERAPKRRWSSEALTQIDQG